MYQRGGKFALAENTNTMASAQDLALAYGREGFEVYRNKQPDDWRWGCRTGITWTAPANGLSNFIGRG